MARFAADGSADDFIAFGAASGAPRLVQFCAGTLNHDFTCLNLLCIIAEVERGQALYPNGIQAATLGSQNSYRR